MNVEEVKERIAAFLFVLATMLIAMTVYYGVEGMIVGRPVLTVRNAPFVVGTPVVAPGGIVTYNVDYFKRLDIPGELYKQLIIKDSTGREYYLPLEGSAGHLPPGVVNKTAFARIPDWAPEGIGRIKLSSMHLTSRGPQFNTAYTDTFEVKK